VGTIFLLYLRIGINIDIMDFQFFTERTVLVFLALHSAINIFIFVLLKFLHSVRVRKLKARGLPTPRFRLVAIVIALVYITGLLVFSTVYYHPILGEHYLKQAREHGAKETVDKTKLKESYNRARHHFSILNEILKGKGFWNRIHARFLKAWRGWSQVKSHLAETLFNLKDCTKVIPYLAEELKRFERAKKKKPRLIAENAFRLAVCHIQANNREKASDYLLISLLVDGRYKIQAMKYPKLRPILIGFYKRIQL